MSPVSWLVFPHYVLHGTRPGTGTQSRGLPCFPGGICSSSRAPRVTLGSRLVLELVPPCVWTSNTFSHSPYHCQHLHWQLWTALDRGSAHQDCWVLAWATLKTLVGLVPQTVLVNSPALPLVSSAALISIPTHLTAVNYTDPLIAVWNSSSSSTLHTCPLIWISYLIVLLKPSFYPFLNKSLMGQAWWAHL